jgi:subtilase family serine protease
MMPASASGHGDLGVAGDLGTSKFRGMILGAHMRSTRNWRAKLVVGVLSVLSLLVFAVSGAAAASSRLAKVGSTPVLPNHAVMTGALPATRQLQLTVMMRPQNPSGLAALATEISTPGTPLFRHYLSVAQFAHQFAPNAIEIGSVESALRAQGLNVGTITANDLTIPVNGTAAQAEKAFSVSLNQVRLPSGRIAFANAEAPTLPASIAPLVEGVIGLDDVNPDQPVGATTVNSRSSSAQLGQNSSATARPNVTTGGPQPCQAASAEIGAYNQQFGDVGYTADQVADMYQFPGLYGAGDMGAGQTIALFEQQPYDPTDIATYQACYGTSAAITNIDVAGGPGPYAPPPGGSGDGESALDLEQAIGLAPKANILVYQGPDSATVQIISQIVSDDRAKVISSSYGLCEALTGGTVINAENPLLQEAAAQGQSFFISSGDSGSAMCYQATHGTANVNTSLSVIDPGGQPFATGVGGTSVFTTSLPTSPSTTCPCFWQPGDPFTEGVWNDGLPNGAGQKASGSGGGISSSFAMPTYQSGAAGSLHVINSNSSGTPCAAASFCREVPDVSANADDQTGYVTFTDGAWGVEGGTSAAAPLWAAFTALANASPACRGLPVGFVNPALYQIAGSSYLNNFNDVSNPSPFTNESANPGSNDALGSNGGLFPVGTGYDMATGLGSMIAPALASSLCALRAPVYSVAVTSPGALVTTVGQAVALPVHGADSGGQALSYSASGLPAGLSISPSTGVISGTTTTPEATTVTVAASDQFTNAGSVAFTWTVVNPVGKPTTKSVKLSGLSQGKPKFSFTVGAGSNAPALKSVSITLPGGLSFAKKVKSLDKGISLKSGGKKDKFTVKLSHGVLTISFKSAVRIAAVTIGAPAISISRSERTKISDHKVKRLTVDLKTTDTSNHSIKFAITLKKLS